MVEVQQQMNEFYEFNAHAGIMVHDYVDFCPDIV